MKMAKATEQDLKYAAILTRIIEAIDKDEYPPDADGELDPKEWLFDDENPEHLRFLYRQIKAIGKKANLFRVTFGFVVLRDNCADPKADTIEFNEKIQQGFNDSLRIEYLAEKIGTTPDEYRKKCDEGIELRKKSTTNTQARDDH